MLNKLYLINKDCYVEEDIPNTDTSNETVLYYGQYIGNEVIMYIQSTPLPLYDTLPNDFSFTINGYHQDYAQPINIYRTTQDWVDTITWNDVQPTYASTPYGSITTGSAGWQSYDLTQHGYDWLTGTEINYGLRYSHPTTSTYGSFLSSEYAAKYLRPYFLINGTFGTEDTSELITSDTYLDPNNTTTNYSTAETLTFGNDSTYDDYRTLIQIDNDYVETISTLYQCRLYLYVTAETVETTTGVGYHVVVNSVDAS